MAITIGQLCQLRHVVSHEKLVGISQANSKVGKNLTEGKPPTGSSESQKLCASHEEKVATAHSWSRGLCKSPTYVLVDFAEDLKIVGIVGTEESREQGITLRSGFHSITTSRRLCFYVGFKL